MAPNIAHYRNRADSSFATHSAYHSGATGRRRCRKLKTAARTSCASGAPKRRTCKSNHYSLNAAILAARGAFSSDTRADKRRHGDAGPARHRRWRKRDSGGKLDRGDGWRRLRRRPYHRLDWRPRRPAAPARDLISRRRRRGSAVLFRRPLFSVWRPASPVPPSTH